MFETSLDVRPDLMARRVREVLLVASDYDSWLMEEEGPLSEGLDVEYRQLGLSAPPRITHAKAGEEALKILDEREIDLVIAMPRLGEMDVRGFARAARERHPDVAIVVLAYTPSEATRIHALPGLRGLVDRVFVWQGDVRLLLAVVKSVEDAWNVRRDTELSNVRVIIVVEDSEPFYSTYLPVLYAELVSQNLAVMADGVNARQRLRRMRARPKILLAENFEDGWGLYSSYRDHVHGVITDASFTRDGVMDPHAGLEFTRRIKAENPDMPVLVQSHDESLGPAAGQLGAFFLHKGSPRLLEDVRDFMRTGLGFGDFVFRLPDGAAVDRAADLAAMQRALATVPEASLRFHATRNHFSNWCMARTEFDLARRLRPIRVTEFDSVEGLRRYLLAAFTNLREETQRGEIAEFSIAEPDRDAAITRIGTGSLGGKGRGLAFVASLLARRNPGAAFPGVRIGVPPCVVLATGVFDRFVRANDLLPFATSGATDEEIATDFRAGRMDPGVVAGLRAFLTRCDRPIAVRSSSVFEDSHDRPCAGVYLTVMLANNDPDPEVRLRALCDAVRTVWASTFFRDAKAYLRNTPYRAEEEKMAVVIQRLVGRRHEDVFYPDIAGVARSRDFYPVLGGRPEDGVALAALGLGTTVVQGERCVRFTPRSARALPQYSTTAGVLDSAQRQFRALDLSARDSSGACMEGALVRLEVEDAERHGTLSPVASTYSPEDDVVRDGTSQAGIRLATFAPILRGAFFPLRDVLAALLDLGERAVGCPVEIEFAVDLKPEDGGPPSMAFLQVRPMGLESAPVDLDDLASRVPAGGVLCRSARALGQGAGHEIRDVVYVKPGTLDRARTADVAAEVDVVNADLSDGSRPYLLVGPGRWGTSDPWLGIPVAWHQIAGVRAIVETDLGDVHVEPSEGTHFFQNITAAGIPYFQVDRRVAGDFVDFGWLDGHEAAWEGSWVRHVRLREPLCVQVDGRSRRGIVLKGDPDGGHGRADTGR